MSVKSVKKYFFFVLLEPYFFEEFHHRRVTQNNLLNFCITFLQHSELELVRVFSNVFDDFVKSLENPQQL
jgi:hypothetical protein